MLLQWEEYSRIRYTEKLKVEKCAIPEIAKKSGKVKTKVIKIQTPRSGSWANKVRPTMG